MCTIGKYTLALGASASSGWQSLYLCDQAALLQLLFDQDIARPRRLARASALQDLGRTFFAAAVEARKRNDERVQGFVRAGQDMRLFAAMQERLFEVVHGSSRAYQSLLRQKLWTMFNDACCCALTLAHSWCVFQQVRQDLLVSFGCSL